MEHTQTPAGFDTNPDHRQALQAIRFLALTIVQMDSTDATETEIAEFCADLQIVDPR